MKRFQRKIDPIGFGLPVLLLVVWHLTAKGGRIPPYLLPAPERIVRVMVDFADGASKLTPYSGKMPANLIMSLFRVAAGFGIASTLGLLLGFFTGRFSAMKRILDPTVHALRTVPGIGWLPIAIVWFGVGEWTTVFLIALAAFFPIYINTAHGAAEVPELLLRAGRMLGAGPISLFSTVILPAAFPSVVAGLRLGLGISWAYLVLGELTGVSSGLGAIMMDSRMMGQVEMIIVSMICIAVLGILSDRLLLKVCRIILPEKGS